jgi:hypothetical protein
MEPISTPQEFYNFATKTDSVSEDRYYLTNDIDFSGFSWELDVLNNNVIFRGVLDGNGHTISNLTIYNNSSAYTHQGIFTIIDGGTVKNLVLDNVDLSLGSLALSGSSLRSGLIAGEINGSTTISNITITNSGVRATSDTGAGGIVGYVFGTNTFLNINNIKASNLKVWSGNSNPGGIIGQIDSNVLSVSISNIDIEVDVFSFMNSSYVGGVIGMVGSGSSLTITSAVIEMSSQNTLETSSDYLLYSKKFIGGLIGYNLTDSSLLTISDTFFTGNLITDSSSKSVYVGTAIGRNGGSFTMTNSFYSMVQFKHTDGSIYYTPDRRANGEFSTVVNDSSMPSNTWWNSFSSAFDGNLWSQDGSGRLYLIR